MKKIAIYGFGRIGRQFLRISLDRKLSVPVAAADVKDVKTLSALFSIDTNYGRWQGAASTNEQGFVLDEHEISYINSANGVPNWGDLGVELVVDCSGRATRRE